MAVWDIFKVSRKTFFNPSAWLDINSIRENNRAIRDSLTGLFVTPTPLVEESFEQAMQRMGVNEADIKTTEHHYYLYSIIFLILGLLILAFCFYLLFRHASFTGWLLGIASAGLCFGQAFRFNFWYFQIKNRKLGCTFQEWRKGEIHKSSEP